MLRTLPVVIVLAALTASCALTEPVPPPGTAALKVQVANRSPNAVALAVSVQGRPLPNSAQPSALRPGETAEVTFFVPTAAPWTIAMNNQEIGIDPADVGRTTRGLMLYLDADGGAGWECREPC